MSTFRSEDEQRPGTFNLRGLLLLVAFAAACLAVGRWFFPDSAEAAFWTVGPVAAVPLVLIVERVFRGRPRFTGRPPMARLGIKFASLVGVALLFPTVFILTFNGIVGLPFRVLNCDPFLYVVPILFFWQPEPNLWLYWLYFSPAPVSFLALNLYLVRADGPMPVPWRVPLLLTTATLATIYWFVDGWSDGLKYQGAKYVHETFAANAMALATLWTIWIVVRRRAGFLTLLGLAIATHAWLFFIAFPWLGEMM